MKNILVALLLTLTVTASGQHFRKCYCYYQDTGGAAIDTVTRLAKVQYFSAFGKIQKEEDYRYVLHAEYAFDTTPRSWTTYTYIHDTILVSSLFCRFQWAGKTTLDSNLTRYYYNKQGFPEVDSSFYSGEISYQSYDVIRDFIGTSIEVNNYFYDKNGRKTEQVNTELIRTHNTKLGHKKTETFEYDTSGYLWKRTLSYQYNSNSSPLRPDVGEFYYRYRNGNLYEIRQYSPDGKELISDRELHNYESDSEGIIKEIIEKGGEKNIIEYGYFPDKRKIKESIYSIIETYRYE